MKCSAEEEDYQRWSNLIKANLNIANYAQSELQQGNFLNTKLIVSSLNKNVLELPPDLPLEYQQGLTELKAQTKLLERECKQQYSPRKEKERLPAEDK